MNFNSISITNSKRNWTRKQMLIDLKNNLQAETKETVIKKRNTYYLVESGRLFKATTTKQDTCDYKVVSLKAFTY